ncbi:MAG: DUF1127 domain-containing protein [Pseudomonadota bacterium]
MARSITLPSALTTPRNRPAKTPTLWTLLTLARSRADLRKLDARGLQDIGLTAEDARTEADRPLWDVPAAWRR